MSVRLQACHQAWTLTQQMLEAARQGFWDDLPELQSERQAMLSVLEDPTLPVDAAAETTCLQQMLVVQPVLESLVQAQRSELSQLLRARQAGRVMSQEYGQLNTGVSNER